MYIFVSQRAYPGDYVINKYTDEIKYVKETTYNGAIEIKDRHFYTETIIEYWDPEDYYVLFKIHDNEIPPKAIPEVKKLLANCK